MPPLDLAAIREKLQGSSGRDYWRSLDELAQTEEFKEYVKHEFPRQVDLWLDSTSRRSFLKLMGASIGLAMFSGCRKPLEAIIPYNQAPEDVLPGKPLYFATALPHQGYARGVLVESQTGRPSKIEGNPQHPDSLGASDVKMQAAILEFYDPDRSQVVTKKGAISSWSGFLDALGAVRSRKGEDLRILTETITSPSLGAQLAGLRRRFPAARWHQYAGIPRDNMRAGARTAFGRAVETVHRFDQARVIVSLDSDFLVSSPGSLRYARDFASGRSVVGGASGMNRLYVLEPTPTVTGTMADHHVPMSTAQIGRFAWLLARELDLSVPAVGAGGDAASAKNVKVLARDLRRYPRQSLIVVGDSQPAAIHALAHAMNQSLGNTGTTVDYIESVEVEPIDQTGSLRDLTADVKAGKVSTLLILGGNPVYNAPADLDFARALSQVPMTAHLGVYADETSAACQWHIPQAHALEAWGDMRAYDGTVSIIQPLIEPLYGGKTEGEVLSALLDGSPRSAHELVRDHWKGKLKRFDFEAFWQTTLHDGVMAGTALAAPALSLQTGFLRTLKPPALSPDLEVVFKADPYIEDGRYANNGWLQECPRPITKMTWDNAALVSPKLAERLHLANEDVVELTLNGRRVEAPVFIVPGQAESSVTVHLGYGRTRAGRVGDKTGFDAYPLRTSEAMTAGDGLQLRRTGAKLRLACTQTHYTMDGRDQARSATLAEFEKDPAFAKDAKAPSAKQTLFDYSKPAVSDEYAWAMGIDLNACIGCNACVVACQAENNIPIVGKTEVLKGREMHWIRVDRYFQGDMDNPRSMSQPVPCMHCEDAPCEVVCPVGATVHSEEGLNEMVYNRCIGTRYCSNNCPYKVRRFNFFDYSAPVKGTTLEMLENPDVTVRSRGVMEKCTYCVQRINGAKIQSDKEGRSVRDGEIVTACQQACPARAIQFGNLLDKSSRISQVRKDPRDYALLAELGTRPRTTYQARILNPNPEFEA